MVCGHEPCIFAVVVNLNGMAYIAEALHSLAGQDYPHLTTIVVDNGSTDGSISHIRSSYPTVQVIENGRNIGFGGANNVGIESAMRQGCDCILLLNYDATLERSCVRSLVHTMSASNIGMVGPKILYHDNPQVIWSAGGRVRFRCGSVEHRGIRQRDCGQYDESVDVDYLTACAVLIDGAMLREIGLFDDAYFPSYFEDTDLCQRARRAGFRLVYVPEAVAWHRVSAYSGGGTTALKVRLRVRNQLLFFRRYASWYHWLTIPPCAIVSGVGYAVKWMLLGKLRLVLGLVQGAWSSVVPRRGRAGHYR